ncbi:response regulator transcription factor [Variovorax sp. J2P1-59]|uniref:response regulator transcription factor n=1 Tax=Variovorax flavidus TaxID=3053501 RepID=UPI002577EE9D|nr:response regulator transcription factor [Variovorax sp. J2P1-59]MDM0074983.1 response regulator transcription factor [Variovorax sp. J2P1-59]
MTLRIVVADDHPLIRGGVRMLLKDRTDIAVVAEAHSTDTLLSVLEQTPADLLITDFSMPGGEVTDGLGLLQRLRRDFPNVPIVVLTMMANVGVHSSMLEIGVRGLVDKTSDMTEIIMAIDAVSVGRQYVSGAFRRGLFENPNKINYGASTQLSLREVEVLRLFASGLTVSAISERLARSIKTVSTQKTVAMLKLGLRNDYDIFVYAREHGMDS